MIDEARDRLLVLGGQSNAVWSLPLSGAQAEKWANVTPEGDLPPAGAAAAIYDAAADRVVAAVVPGAVINAGNDVEVWELSLADAPRFRRLNPSGDFGDGVRNLQVFADADELIVQGSAPEHEGAWRLSLEGGASWERVAAVPGLSLGTRLVLDTPRRRLLAFDQQLRALSLDDNSWSKPFDNACPYGPLDHLLLDASNQQVVVFDHATGGWCSYSLIDDTWRRGSGEITPAFAAAVIDPERDRLLTLFTGSFEPAGNAIWQAPLETLSPAPFTPDTRGPAPSSATTVWDPRQQQLYAFGGLDGSTFAHALAPSATWVDQKMPRMARGGGACGAYDPEGEAILAFGEITELGLMRLASERGSSWRALDATGPEPRSGCVGVYDSRSRRFLVHAGVRDLLAEGETLSDTWALSLNGAPAWTELRTTGQGPGDRGSQQGVYDPVGNRLIVYGGYRDGELIDDLHALSLADDALEWSVLEASGQHPEWSGALYDIRAVYDTEGQRMIVVALPYVAALELGDSPAWHRFCDVGRPPRSSPDSPTTVALVPDGLFVGVGNAAYRFDLATPYCD